MYEPRYGYHQPQPYGCGPQHAAPPHYAVPPYAPYAGYGTTGYTMPQPPQALPPSSRAVPRSNDVRPPAPQQQQQQVGVAVPAGLQQCSPYSSTDTTLPPSSEPSTPFTTPSPCRTEPRPTATATATATAAPGPKYPKTLYLIRHAHSTCNVHGDSTCRDVFDPSLTTLGKQQVHYLKQKVDDILFPCPTDVFVSPLTRTLETATEVFCDYMTEDGDLPEIIALDGLREMNCCGFPCDYRRSRAALQHKYPCVDFTGLAADEDPLAAAKAVETKASFQARAKATLDAVLAWERSHCVAVVAHYHVIVEMLRLLQSGRQWCSEHTSVKSGNIPGLHNADVLCVTISSASDDTVSRILSPATASKKADV